MILRLNRGRPKPRRRPKPKEDHPPPLIPTGQAWPYVPIPVISEATHPKENRSLKYLGNTGRKVTLPTMAAPKAVVGTTSQKQIPDNDP
jgi:hypothetical protein